MKNLQYNLNITIIKGTLFRANTASTSTSKEKCRAGDGLQYQRFQDAQPKNFARFLFWETNLDFLTAGGTPDLMGMKKRRKKKELALWEPRHLRAQ